jgi:MinD superfamily P-loop ATPase
MPLREGWMKQLTIISGKGGTGKTTITAAFATLARNAVLADCDVDAADLHLILEPDIRHYEIFYGGKVAAIDASRCTQCGICQDICRFDAIHAFRVDHIACEGCRICTFACPEKAISMQDQLSGHWYISNTRCGPMVHARLGIAEDNSGKLVSVVRQQAKQIAESEHRELVIIDGPPGIGCPVIASITGVDLVLVVTEPTLSGLHDMERVLLTAAHFTIPALVCVNKYDINRENTEKIEARCAALGIAVVGKIPYDRSATAAMLDKKSVVEYTNGGFAAEVKQIWGKVASAVSAGRPVHA